MTAALTPEPALPRARYMDTLVGHITCAPSQESQALHQRIGSLENRRLLSIGTKFADKAGFNAAEMSVAQLQLQSDPGFRG